MIVYKEPEGYNDSNDHFANFFDSIRTGKPVVEDAVLFPCRPPAWPVTTVILKTRYEVDPVI